MKSRIVEHYCSYAQHSLIAKVSDASPCTGRLLALPVMILDVTLETVKWPLALIEAAAFAAINVGGAALYYTPLADRVLKVLTPACLLEFISKTSNFKVVHPASYVDEFLENCSCMDALGHIGTFILHLTWNIPTTIINAPHMVLWHIHAAVSNGLDKLKTIDDRFMTDTTGWSNTKIIYYMIGHDEQPLVIGHPT